MGRKEVDKCADKHIRIMDLSICEKIDEIMLLTSYKSFNKVINDALVYGLPILLERKIAGVRNEHKEQETAVNNNVSQQSNNVFYAQAVLLLREIVLNQTINKSILCSLFNAKAIECGDSKVKEKEFLHGELANTPLYLEDFELRELAKLRE